MPNAATTFTDQLFKNFDKAPGWGYLLVAVLVFLHEFGVEDKGVQAWIHLPIPVEVIALVLTFVVYQFGDAIDDLVFKKRINGEYETRPIFKKHYEAESGDAQIALGLNSESGLYGLAAKLTATAEKERGKIFVYLSNEFAKFMRSVAGPLLFLGAIAFLIRKSDAGIILMVSAASAFFLYPWLKVLHVKKLYKLVERLTKKNQYSCRDAGNARFYFWGNKLVSAIPREEKF